jgi:hypothetical protein
MSGVKALDNIAQYADKVLTKSVRTRATSAKSEPYQKYEVYMHSIFIPSPR